MNGKNTVLSFFVENDGIYSSQIGDYFNEFSFDDYDLQNISCDSEKQSELIQNLNKYFESQMVRFSFPSGFVSVGYNSSPEIRFDQERINQIRDGYIPIIIWFFEPYIPITTGYFSWEK